MDTPAPSPGARRTLLRRLAMPRADETVRVWDPLVRLFHWSLVATYVVAYVTEEAFYDLHLIAGYAVLGLIAFRLVWGVVGPRHARFADFIYRPSRIKSYLLNLPTRHRERHLGHNPAGGAMILTLLLCLLVITVSGVALDAAENRSGPLGHTTLFHYTSLIEAIHEGATDVSAVLIGLHLFGVLVSSLAHGENLVRAMVTGRKRPLSTQSSP